MTDTSAGWAPDSAAYTADVAVVGGGLGGIAAALAAADAGCTVVLTEQTTRVGGLVTTQLVSALDEHEHIETFAPASYSRLRDSIRAAHGGRANPGGGWVSRLCFEPDVAERVLCAMLAPHQERGRLRVLTGHRPVEAHVAGDRVQTVRLAGHGGDVTVRARMFCDATELGDLLPLTDAPWVAGSEGQDAHAEPDALPGGPQPTATQAITWCLAVENVPDQDHTGPAQRDTATCGTVNRSHWTSWAGTTTATGTACLPTGRTGGPRSEPTGASVVDPTLTRTGPGMSRSSTGSVTTTSAPACCTSRHGRPGKRGSCRWRSCTGCRPRRPTTPEPGAATPG